MSAAAVTPTGRGSVLKPTPRGSVAKPSAQVAHRTSSASTTGAAATTKAAPKKPKVVLETAHVSYRLRINKHSSTPAMFLKETKTLDYWHCKAPNWMMPFYHWGSASAPETIRPCL